MPELPPDLVPFINILGVIVAGVLIGHRYYKSYVAASATEKEAKPSAEVQIVGGALADRVAMAGLQGAIERLCDVLERLIEEQERRDRERGHAAEVAELRREIERLRYQQR
jgi:hypothetical protein